MISELLSFRFFLNVLYLKECKNIKPEECIALSRANNFPTVEKLELTSLSIKAKDGLKEIHATKVFSNAWRYGGQTVLV
jgi:hypothetical protein